jgi:hypothetical protein
MHHHDHGLSVADVSGIIAAVGTMVAAFAAVMTAILARRQTDRANETYERAREALSATYRPANVRASSGHISDLDADTGESQTEIQVGPVDTRIMRDVSATIYLGGRTATAHAELVGGAAGPLSLPLTVGADGDTHRSGHIDVDFTDEQRLGRWRAHVILTISGSGNAAYVDWDMSETLSWTWLPSAT